MNIIAIGGGGFTQGTDAALENYLLSTVSKPQPTIGFLGTASGDDETKLKRFYARFNRNTIPTHLSLSGGNNNIAQWVLEQDIIYVGGGNTKIMLAIWHNYHLPELLQQALSNGTTLTGVSAGAVCWFETALSDSSGTGLHPLPCLGILSGSCCPHFDEDGSLRRERFEALVSSRQLPNGIGIDDGAAVHYRNGEILKVVTARAKATAYIVHSTGVKSETVPLVAEVT